VYPGLQEQTAEPVAVPATAGPPAARGRHTPPFSQPPAHSTPTSDTRAFQSYPEQDCGRLQVPATIPGMPGFCGSSNCGPDRIQPTSPSPTCSGEAVCSLERSARESSWALSSLPTHTSVQLSTETHKESVDTDSLTVCQSPSARLEPTVTFFVSCPVPRDRRTPPASERLTEIRSLASRNSFPVEIQVLKENPIWDPRFNPRFWSNITYEEPLVS